MIYTFGPFTLNVNNRTLHRDSMAIALTAKVFDTLVLLIRHCDRALTKDELIQAVWPNVFASEESLTQNVCLIRRALGDDANHPRYIRTLARRGYRFIAPVTEGISTRTVAVPARRRWMPFSLAGAVVAGVLLAVRLMVAPGAGAANEAPRPRLQFREPLPAATALTGGAALSPNGRYLAYTAVDRNGVSKLWIRMLEESDSARVLENTDGASDPFWSPDSQFIGYYNRKQIVRIAIEGGAPRPITSVQRLWPLGVSWGSTGQILYADRAKVLSVPASGGTPVVAADPGQIGGGELRWPHFLPDGRHFLFVVDSDDPNRAGGYVGTLGSTATVKVTGRVAGPMTYAAGHLVFLRDRTLFAQAFDASKGAVKSAPRALVSDVESGAELSATSNGLLAVTQHKQAARASWLDRAGHQLGESFPVQKALRDLALRPDGKAALGTSYDAGTIELWKLDLERRVTTRMAGSGGFPAWAPDGARFAFVSVRDGSVADLMIASADGGDQSVVFKNDDIKVINDWSLDGRYLLFYVSAKDHDGLWTVPARGRQREAARVTVQGHAVSGRLSPDGRRIAYVSDESDTSEVYLETFPDSGGRQRVSVAGGTQPQWRGDGKELFFMSADHHVMAAPIVGGVARVPTQLFALPNGLFASSKDGQRFLTVVPEQEDGDDRITIHSDAF